MSKRQSQKYNSSKKKMRNNVITRLLNAFALTKRSARLLAIYAVAHIYMYFDEKAFLWATLPYTQSLHYLLRFCGSRISFGFHNKRPYCIIYTTITIQPYFLCPLLHSVRNCLFSYLLQLFLIRLIYILKRNYWVLLARWRGVKTPFASIFVT